MLLKIHAHILRLKGESQFLLGQTSSAEGIPGAFTQELWVHTGVQNWQSEATDWSQMVLLCEHSIF